MTIQLLTVQGIIALKPRPKRYAVFDALTASLAIGVTPTGHVPVSEPATRRRSASLICRLRSRRLRPEQSVLFPQECDFTPSCSRTI